MSHYLIRDIHTLVTMVDGEPDLRGAHLLIEDGRISEIIPADQSDRLNTRLKQENLEIIDGSHCVVYPGFINTHHHLYQTLTRNIPRVQNAKLFDWLIGLY